MQRSSYMQPHQAYPSMPQQYGTGPASYYNDYLPPMQLPMMSSSGNSVPTGASMYSSPPSLHQIYTGRSPTNGQISPSQGATSPPQANGLHPDADAWSKFDANKFQVL